MKIRDLGEVREYLGMEIKREDEKLKISQTKLIEKLLEKFGMMDTGTWNTNQRRRNGNR